jgi:hypothetical protein
MKWAFLVVLGYDFALLGHDLNSWAFWLLSVPLSLAVGFFHGEAARD